MILVVADTSPLNYLVQIGFQQLLSALYRRILVPAAVFNELTHARTPAIVRAWLDEPPEWLEIREVRSPTEAALAGLGPGECEAIQLAREQHADLLLMDERLGVKLARQQGLEVTGTLGVLLQAARSGLIDLQAALDKLKTTGFRCTPQLLEDVRRSARLNFSI